MSSTQASHTPSHTQPSPQPANLDTAFEEIIEGCCIDWPELLPVEGAGIAIAKLVAVAVTVAGAVVLALWTILS